MKNAKRNRNETTLDTEGFSSIICFLRFNQIVRTTNWIKRHEFFDNETTLDTLDRIEITVLTKQENLPKIKFFRREQTRRILSSMDERYGPCRENVHF